jgi:hypothetical protein
VIAVDKKADSKHFAATIGMFWQMYNQGKEMPIALIEFYWEGLKPLSKEEFNIAAGKVRDTWTHFIMPPVGAFLEGCHEDPVLVAEQAFQTMQGAKDGYRTIVFEDGIIGRCIEALGGWNVVLDWKEEDRKWNLKNFIDLYKRYYERGLALEPVTYIGDFEDHNIRQGYQEFIPERVVVLAIGPVTKLRGFVALNPEQAKLPPKTPLKLVS